MIHLNDSFQAVEEHIIEAIRALGVNAMGLDPEQTRREALDELAMDLENLKTGTQTEHEENRARAEAMDGLDVTADGRMA